MDARPLRTLTVLVFLAVVCHAATTAFATPPQPGASQPATSQPVLPKILQQWSQATADARPTGRRERERLLEVHHGELSAHEVDVLCRLSGPVDAEQLRARFDWTAEALPGGGVYLTGRPRDEVESLFYRQVEVTINAQSGLPESFRFIGHDGQPKGEELMAGIRWRTDTLPPGLVNGEQPLRVASLADLEELRPVPPDDRHSRIAAILVGWERACQAEGGQTLHFHRLRFDSAARVEYRADGLLRMDAQGHCRLEIKPAEIAPGELSIGVSADGRHFTLRADSPQTCGFHRDAPPPPVPAIHLAGFESEAPPLGAARPSDVAALLIDFDAQAAQRSFQVRLLGSNPDQYHLELRPRDAADRASFGTAEVLLDRQTLRPRALRFLDANTGETEVVYLIEESRPGTP